MSKIRIDNATKFYVNRQGGTRSTLSGRDTIPWSWCIWNIITLTAVPLPGLHNILADHLSKHFSQNHTWSIKESVTKSIISPWGAPCTDLFVTKQNKKCKVFCSRGIENSSSQGDAFLIPWIQGLLYTYSPNSSHLTCVKESQTVQGISHPNGPGMAQAILVHGNQKSLSDTSKISTFSTRFNYSEQWDNSFSQLVVSPLHGMEAVWLKDLKKNCAEDVQSIQIPCTEQSTRTIYSANWKYFSSLFYKRNCFL